MFTATVGAAFCYPAYIALESSDLNVASYWAVDSLIRSFTDPLSLVISWDHSIVFLFSAAGPWKLVL